MSLDGSFRTRAGFAALVVAGALLTHGPAIARAVQPPATLSANPSTDALRLNAALARLARDPRDVGALIDAGSAALATHDVDAAIGFFTRADQVSPRNPKALAGLASALLQNDDPIAAIAVFDQAEAAGAHDLALNADRGLAHDLVGENARAQQYYRQALSKGDDAETERRLALSQAISGDAEGAEATLRPLLQSQDKAGWRTRAFVFAIGGQVEEAVTVARTLLPPDLAAAITPYLRYMPRLTRAQQAAAANLGAFPRASDIGTDDPRIAAYAAGRGPSAAGQQLIPAGESLGRRAERAANRPPKPLTKAERAAALAARAAPPDPVPVRTESPPVGSTGAPQQVPPPSTSAPTRPRLPAATTYGPPNLADAAGSPASFPAPKPAPAAAGPVTAIAPPRKPPRSLADAFSDLGAPTVSIAARAGAVDVAKLAAARRSPPKPPPPTHPSRIWVQLGTGRDRGALGSDWRRFMREGGSAFRGRAPFVSEWGARNRLLTGPFESEAAARGFIQQLAKASYYGPFIWVSPAGQVVDSLVER